MIDYNNLVVRNDFVELLKKPHILIAGTTGAGKTTLLNNLMYTLLCYTERQIQFALIDPKKIELDKYRHCKHCCGYADTTEIAVDILFNTCNHMDKIYREMKETNDYSTKLYPDLYIIIDELADLMVNAKNEVIPLLQRLLQLGRTARIHIIACTQAPNRKVLPAELTLNFTERIALRCQNRIESTQIINEKGAEKLPRYGQALYLSCGYIEPLHFDVVDNEILDYMIKRNL